MTIPNFFIVGAPKCGTTALHSYLGQHPDVFVSRVKEPHFFCTDLPNERRYVSRDAYLELFREADEHCQAVGESSSRYLYSRDAVENILRFNPHAKLIAMLRNPVELVPSLHSQLLYDFKEDERDFETAWNLQTQRALGRYLPRRCRSLEDLQYGMLARLGKQAERLLDCVDRDQIMFILFDDFKDSPSSVYKTVLDFLEVDHRFEPCFERVNASKAWRSPALAKLLSNPPFPLNRIKSGVKKSLRLMETSLATTIYARLTVSQSRPPLSETMRDTLVAYFQNDIEKLSQLLDRDLSHWLTPSGTSRVARPTLANTSP